jgi:hypothetical protein
MENKYEQYALLSCKLKELEAEQTALREEILTDMQAKGERSIEHTLGKFTVQSRKKWTYPESVLKKEEAYKLAKTKAELNGTATFIENHNLTFTIAKL